MAGLPLPPPVTMSDATASVIRPFMIHQAPVIDDAWSNAAIEFQRKREEASKLMQLKTNRYKQFMGQLSKVSKQTQLAKFNVNGNYTFLDVKREADKAVEKYKDQGRSWRHPFRTAGRHIGDTTALEAFLNVLPNQSLYASVVCGSLMLVYGAAASMSDVRKKIFDALESLSGTVSWSSEFLELYEADDTLATKAEELYLALLEGIEGMMEWLDHKAYTEAMKSLFQQDNYGKPIKKKIDAIEEKSRAFQKRIDYLLHERVMSIGTEVKEGRRENQVANRTLITLLVGFVKDAEWFAGTVLQRMQRLEQNQYFLPGVVQQHLIQNSQPQVALEEIIDVLNVDPTILAHDEYLARISGMSLSMRSQDRMAWVFHNPVFQSWFRSRDSAMLLISDSSTEEDGRPGISFFSATLSQVLRDMMVTMPMTFFCRRHTAPEDQLQGAVGILQTLSSGLIRQLENFNFAFIDSELLDGLQKSDIFALSGLFQELMVQDKCSVFFIILDELSLYDTPQRSDDVRDIVQFLRDLARKLNEETAQNQRQTVLKILITCSSISYNSRSWFPDDEILTIPWDVHGQSQGFNELQMSFHAEQLLDAANNGAEPDAT